MKFLTIFGLLTGYCVDYYINWWLCIDYFPHFTMSYIWFTSIDTCFAKCPKRYWKFQRAKWLRNTTTHINWESNGGWPSSKKLFQRIGNLSELFASCLCQNFFNNSRNVHSIVAERRRRKWIFENECHRCSIDIIFCIIFVYLFIDSMARSQNQIFIWSIDGNRWLRNCWNKPD